MYIIDIKLISNPQQNKSIILKTFEFIVYIISTRGSLHKVIGIFLDSINLIYPRLSGQPQCCEISGHCCEEGGNHCCEQADFSRCCSSVRMRLHYNVTIYYANVVLTISCVYVQN